MTEYTNNVISIAQKDVVNKIKSILTTFRIDIKNYGNEENAIEVLADQCDIVAPSWFKDNQGQGIIIQSENRIQKFTLKIINDGLLSIIFKGIDRNYNGKRIPIWVNYKSIKIDGEEILSKPIKAWHDKVFSYSAHVTNGQIITIEIEQTKQQYLSSEIKDIITKLYPNEENIDLLVSETRKYFSSLITINKYQESFLQNLKTNCYLSKSLSVTQYKNAYILPSIDGNFMKIPWSKGGVLDENKQYIKNSCSLREMEGEYNFDSFNIIEEPVLYMGFFFKHWGHFLLEYISRLWPIVNYPDKYKNIKVAYLPMRKEDMIDGTFEEFFRFCGIKKEQLIAITSPTQCRELFIPDPCSFYPNATYTNEYKDVINKVTKEALKINSDVQLFDKIYLSHNSLKSYENRDIGENNIENFFEINGFKLINPEKFSLAQQIKVINNAKEIVAPLGTLSHNFLFTNPSSKLTIIGKYLGYSNYQTYIDQVIGKKPTYVDCSASIFPYKDSSGPFLYLYNRNLKLFAEDNGYKVPDIEMLEVIKKYIEVSVKKYKFYNLNLNDIINAIKTSKNIDIEDISKIIAVMFEIIANKN